MGEPEAETPPGGQASPTGVGAHGDTQRCNKSWPKAGALTRGNSKAPATQRCGPKGPKGVADQGRAEGGPWQEAPFTPLRGP